MEPLDRTDHEIINIMGAGLVGRTTHEVLYIAEKTGIFFDPFCENSSNHQLLNHIAIEG